MAIPTRTSSATGKQSGSTSLTMSVSGIATDSYMVCWLVEGNTSTALTLPSGWDVISGPNTVGSRRYWVLGRIKVPGDTFVVAKAGSVVVEAIMEWGTGSDPVSAWQVGAPFARSSGTGADDQYAQAPAIVTGEADMLVLAGFIEATSAEDTTPQALAGGSGFTLLAQLDDQASPDTTFIDQILVAYKEMAVAGSTGTPQVNYQNAQNINAGGIQIGITPAAPSNAPPVAAFSITDQNWLTVDVDGTASTDSDGTIVAYIWDWGDGTSTGSAITSSHTYDLPGTYTITLTVLDDDSATDEATDDVTVVASPMIFRNGEHGQAFYRNGKKSAAMYFNGVLLRRWGHTVAEMLATPEIQVAWRGLGYTYSEMSLAGYAAAVAAGFKVLEASVHYTSDGVPVLIHDATVNAMTSGTGNVVDKTWADIQALTVDVGAGHDGQLHRLEEVLDLYAETHVFFIDDKTNMAHTADVLALIDNYPNPQQHFVWKGFRGWSPAADVWTAAGYETWGIYYNDEMDGPHTSLTHFSMLGLNYDADQSNWDIGLATGKRVFGHVIGNGTNATTARSKGATGLMTGVVL